jgi:hypothetical protein
MSGGASEGAPPLDAWRQALFVGPVRLALGAAGLLAAASMDLSFGTALAEAGAGAGLMIFALVVPGGRHRPWRVRSAEPAPVSQAWWRALASAMFPSTYGVAVLTGIALVFNRGLAAFLAGVLLAMGVLALVYAFSAR